MRTLERFTDRQIARQRAMYAADVPFIEKWRTAMRYLVSDDFAYEKVWYELQALAWNRPDLRGRVDRVNSEWRAVLTEAFAEARERYGIEMPLDALVSLVITFNEGIILERLSGVEEGHARPARVDRRLDGGEGEQWRRRSDRSAGARADARPVPGRDGLRRAGRRPRLLRGLRSGEPTVFLLPTWSIIHSRHWKMQIPYLARHCRVVTFDGRGNGRSDRPQDAAAYDEREFAADALAVLDATETERAVIVGFSLGSQRGLILAAEHPERVTGAVFIGPNYPGGGEPLPERAVHDFDVEYDTYEGWAKYNRYYWLREYRDFVEYFMSKIFTEPHSTKPFEDARRLGPRDGR